MDYDLTQQVGRRICNTSALSNISSDNLKLPQPLYCDYTEYEDSIGSQVFFAMAFFFLMAFAIIGNAVVMWIIFHHRVMHHGFNFFLFNMALADLMIALFNVGSTWTFNFYYDWWWVFVSQKILSRYGSLCTPTTFFGIAPTTVSVFSMMSLSWDRCQAVVNPLRKRPLSRKRSLHAITVIWIFSALTALPLTVIAKVDEVWFYNIKWDRPFVRRLCTQDETTHVPISLVNQLLFVIQYALPLFVLSFTFARIALAFRSTDEATDLANNSKGTSHTKAKSKAVKMLALMVFAFMFCWLPYHLYHTFELSELFPPQDQQTSKYIYLVIYWIAMSSTAYNPIIYCMANERFRIGFRFAFRWLPFVQYRKEDYEYSQLFPEKLRTMAICMQMGKRIPDQSSTGFTFHSANDTTSPFLPKDKKRKPRSDM